MRYLSLFAFALAFAGCSGCNQQSSAPAASPDAASAATAASATSASPSSNPPSINPAAHAVEPLAAGSQADQAALMVRSPNASIQRNPDGSISIVKDGTAKRLPKKILLKPKLSLIKAQPPAASPAPATK